MMNTGFNVLNILLLGAAKAIFSFKDLFFVILWLEFFVCIEWNEN